MPFEGQQLRGRGLLEDVQPALELALNRDGVQLVPPLAAVSPDENHTRALEDAQVLHDREARELRQYLAQGGRRPGAVTERVEESTTTRRSERLPDSGILGH